MQSSVRKDLLMPRALRRVLLTLLVALVGALLVPVPAHAATLVSGTATDPDGAPISGSAYLYAVGSGSGGGNAVTGGSFSVTALTDGDYQLMVQAASMDGATRWYVAGQPAGTPLRAEATVLHLTGTPVTLEEIHFPASATLSGTVTNGVGQPMSGVTVARNRSGMASSRVTDALGRYDFGYVLPGVTDLSVHGDGTWAGDRAQLTVPAVGDQVVDLVMPTPSTITGVLTDAGSGAGIPMLEVLAYEKVGTGYFFVNQALTDADGHFDVGGLGAGGFVLQYRDDLLGYPTTVNGGGSSLGGAPPLTTSPGATLVHDEVLTQVDDPRPGRSLSGVVTDFSGQPLAGIDVTVRSDDGSVVAQAASDRSGRWGVDVADGDYTVDLAEGGWLAAHESGPPWFPEYYPDSWGPASATAVTVAADTHPGLDVALARAGRLRLAVRGPAGSLDVVPGYRVVDAATGVTAYTAPGAGGSDLSVLVRPGSWKVLVTGATGGGTQLLPQWYGGGVSVGRAPAVDLAVGADLDGGTITLPGRLKATTVPTVKGRPRLGSRLTMTRGSWNLLTDTSFSYVWKRGAKVLGRTASHVVVRRDLGARLTVTLTARHGTLVTRVTRRVPVPG